MDTQSKAHRLPISVFDQIDHVTKFWQHALCAVNFVGTAQSVWETSERPQKLIDGIFQESRAPSATFMLLPYLIFVIFFTFTHFESWKFYTRKVRKFTTNLPRDKTAFTECKIKH